MPILLLLVPFFYNSGFKVNNQFLVNYSPAGRRLGKPILWFFVLMPALDTLKKAQKRKRRIYTLKDLRLKDVKLNEKILNYLVENSQYADTLDEIVASCIIGIS